MKRLVRPTLTKGKPMDEELKEELNETLRKVWLAGWKIREVGLLESFEKAMALALTEGWDAEHEDEIDYTYAVM
jgi:hypothetical protein